MRDDDDRQQHGEHDGFLARIDERVYHLRRSLEDFRDEVRKEFESFVRMSRFRPIEVVVWGLVTLILSAVLTALLAKVLAQ